MAPAGAVHLRSDVAGDRVVPVLASRLVDLEDHRCPSGEHIGPADALLAEALDTIAAWLA